MVNLIEVSVKKRALRQVQQNATRPKLQLDSAVAESKTARFDRFGYNFSNTNQ
jgi:hypothetical protein